MADYLVQQFEIDLDLHSGDRYPSEFEELFKRNGFHYEGTDRACCGEPHVFFGKGIAGYINKVSTEGISKKLKLRVMSDKPPSNSQKEAVDKLLCQLPMFKKCEPAATQ